MAQQINQYGVSQQNAPYVGQANYITNPGIQTGQPMQVNAPLLNTISNSIVWVETEDEAKNWMVGPNNRVFIFVGDNQNLYVKEKNSDGRPLKTEVYDLNKRQIVEEGGSVDLTNYVRKEDVQSMIDSAVSKAISENNRNRQNRRNNYKRYNDGGDE